MNRADLNPRILLISTLVTLALSAPPDVRAAPPSATSTPPPATAPATARGGDALLAEASAAVKAGTLAQLGTRAEAALRPLLANPAGADPAQLTRLAAIRTFAREFSRLEKPQENHAATLQWLLENPALLDTLMMALSEADSPDRVLAVLRELHRTNAQQAPEFPDLTAALCVVWDTPRKADPERPQADAARAAWLFKYLTSARRQLRYDPKDLPWELSVYVVDNEVSQEEIAWATQRYRGRGAVGAVYFDVPYDTEAFLSGTVKKIESHDYTLQNLVRVGGICGDQAYFASRVGRSLGVPACVVSGMSASADTTGHAWVGYLEMRGRNVAWNFVEGRYPELQLWKGQVQDPRTRRHITEADVALLAELLRRKPQDRLASVALTKSAEIVSEGERAAVYQQAIELSPGNREAWMKLAELGAERKLTPAQVTSTMAVIARAAAKQYPDFAFAVIRRLNSGRGTQQQLEALREARRLFPLRPDLQAAMGLAEAELLIQLNKPSAALAVYGQILKQHGNAGPIVLDTLRRVEPLLREHNDLPRLAAIYRETWQRLPQPGSFGFAAGTPYYMVGERYCELLDEIGNAQESARVRSRLDNLTQQSSRSR